MQEQLRRYENILSTSALASIVLGVWSAVKFVIFAIMQNNSSEGDHYTGIDLALYLVALFLFLSVDVGLRIFIGLSARREAAGRKKGWLYICAALLVAISIGFNIVTWVQGLFSGGSAGVISASLIVDATSLYALCELIVSAFNVKRMRRRTGIQTKVTE